MEKSTKFISLSGISGVWVGAIALIGIAFAFFQFNDYFLMRYSDTGVFSIDNLMSFDEYQYFIRFILIDAIIMLVLAIGGAIYFTNRKAKMKGASIWDNS
jgi:hypothetical protein